MILELDIGNTRIKWRVIDQVTNPVASGVAAGLEELVRVMEPYSPARVRISCVRGGALLDEVVSLLQQERQLPVEIARVQRQCQGLKIAYQDLTRLGVDRWLAMLAAYQDADGAVIVVDCGTALTIDLVDSDGSHLGGYIVPGLKLAPHSLTRNTAIRLQSEPAWSLAPGNSTEDAIYHGALLMLVSLIENVVARERPRLTRQNPPVMYLTGGDAGLFAEHVKVPGITVKPARDLVFDGLRLALP